jgi:hypothetical protein
MIIHVMKQHIQQGIQDTNDECPIAQALKEHELFVFNTFLSDKQDYYKAHQSKICKLPNEAIEFVKDFDDGGEDYVEPFSFHLSAECFMR